MNLLSTVTACVSAVAACISVYFAYKAIQNAHEAAKATKDAVRETREAHRTEKALFFSEKYQSEKMRNALTRLNDRFVECDYNTEKMVKAYIIQGNTESEKRIHDEWSKDRRIVSKYFRDVRIVCISDPGIEERIAQILGKAGFELYLKIVVPLDEAHNKSVLGRKDWDSTDRDFFDRFVKRHF